MRFTSRAKTETSIRSQMNPTYLPSSKSFRLSVALGLLLILFVAFSATAMGQSDTSSDQSMTAADQDDDRPGVELFSTVTGTQPGHVCELPFDPTVRHDGSHAGERLPAVISAEHVATVHKLLARRGVDVVHGIV